MKTTLPALFLFSLTVGYGQIVTEPSTPPATKTENKKADVKKAELPTERELTKSETEELQVTMLKIHLLNDKYHLEEYQKEVTPISIKQQHIREELCKSLGVPPDKIVSECGIMGLDNDGDALVGPDGKAVAQKVMWVKPKAPEKK